jgi:hypothetical protein
MNLDLVAMTWASFDAPSAALGILSAYVQANEPRVRVRCHSALLEGHPPMWQVLACSRSTRSWMLSCGERESTVEELVDARLMFREGDRYLSLAVAARPDLALRRLRTEP